MKTQFFYFHIGRGGRFHNAGHVKFVKVTDYINLEQLYEGDNGNYYNCSGDLFLTEEELQKQIERGYIIIDFDGDYDTDIYATADNIPRAL